MAQYTSNKPTSILDLVKFNGRVNIIQPPDMSIQMKMSEKIMISNKANDYRGALNGVFENNILATVFFSSGNIQILQNGIRAGVYDKSGGLYFIPNQNIDNLKIIMRSTYLQYAEHRPTDITQQVERLNKIVLDSPFSLHSRAASIAPLTAWLASGAGIIPSCFPNITPASKQSF